MSTYYRNLQIIKHALKHYITRPNVSQKDIAREKNLLEKIEDQIDIYKKEKQIK